MTDELVDLNVLGFQMPITWLVSFNGFLCIVLAPAFGWYWMKLAEKNNDWRVATKMGWGMILTYEDYSRSVSTTFIVFRWFSKNEHLVRISWILCINCWGITCVSNRYGIIQ